LHLDFLKVQALNRVKSIGPEVYGTPYLTDAWMRILVNIDSAYNLDLHKTAKHSLTLKTVLGHLYISAINNDVWKN